MPIGKKLRGRYTHKRDCNLLMNLKETGFVDAIWIQRSQEKLQCRDLANTARKRRGVSGLMCYQLLKTHSTYLSIIQAASRRPSTCRHHKLTDTNQTTLCTLISIGVQGLNECKQGRKVHILYGLTIICGIVEH
jgi:hypothetical protein